MSDLKVTLSSEQWLKTIEQRLTHQLNPMIFIINPTISYEYVYETCPSNFVMFAEQIHDELYLQANWLVWNLQYTIKCLKRDNKMQIWS